MSEQQEGPTAEQAEEVFNAFLEIMEQAARDEHVGHRLAFADTVVHIHFSDSPSELVLTLFLDRAPVETRAGAHGTPEITIEATTNDVFRFWTGDLHLAMGIARGEVQYTGPVRKLLRVIPIARRLVGDFQKMTAEMNIDPPAGS